MVVTTVYTGELTTAPQVPLCAKNYSFCDDNGCRDQLKSVEVAVPLTSLAYYTATFIVCTDDVCFTTTTPLGE